AKKAVEMAYEAMENPVEGTILTVLSAWSDSLYTDSQQKNSLEQIFDKALKVARIVLGKTKDQLEVLKENDVVDAGAMGVVSFLEGVELLRFNGPVPVSFRKTLNQNEYISGLIKTSTKHNINSEVEFRYCTEVLIDHPKSSPERIRANLKDLGDSLIVSKGVNKSRVHIHSNTPHVVLERLKKYGRIIEQKADDMFRQEQVVNKRLSSTAILTDSIADIPMEFLDKYQIHVLNLTLNWDDEEYLDRITITAEQFYQQQQIQSSFPGSSIPSTQIVTALYQYLTDYYDNIIVLSVAKSLSGTWNQMTKTARSFNKDKKRITVIDTCLNSVAQGLLVKEVARNAAEGKSFEELIALAEDLKKRIKIYVSVSTFKYMVKGGRVSPLKGAIASLLNLKPIVSLDENGKGIAFEKAFSRKGLIKKISRIIEETKEKKGIESYAIVHGDDGKKAFEFSKLIKSITGKEVEYISSISPIVGMHSGKGALAIGIIEGPES
nr:DegV family EDD domain-containing protein [Spirochaetaceae bacterium]